MLKRKEPGAVAPGIAANAPVQRGWSAQGVVPLASPGAVTPISSYLSAACASRMAHNRIIAGLPQLLFASVFPKQLYL